MSLLRGLPLLITLKLCLGPGVLELLLQGLNLLSKPTLCLGLQSVHDILEFLIMPLLEFLLTLSCITLNLFESRQLRPERTIFLHGRLVRDPPATSGGWDSYSWRTSDDVLLDRFAIALSRAATIAADAHRFLAPAHLVATTTIATDTHRFLAPTHLVATTTIGFLSLASGFLHSPITRAPFTLRNLVSAPFTLHDTVCFNNTVFFLQVSAFLTRRRRLPLSLSSLFTDWRV